MFEAIQWTQNKLLLEMGCRERPYKDLLLNTPLLQHQEQRETSLDLFTYATIRRQFRDSLNTLLLSTYQVHHTLRHRWIKRQNRQKKIPVLAEFLKLTVQTSRSEHLSKENVAKLLGKEQFYREAKGSSRLKEQCCQNACKCLLSESQSSQRLQGTFKISPK